MNFLFSKIKYNNPEIPSTMTLKSKLLIVGLYFFVVTPLSIFIGSLTFSIFIIIFFGAIFGAIYSYYLQKDKAFVITPSYILMADKIIYFKNINSFVINHKLGMFSLETPINMITINKRYFYAQSNKEHKIKLSQTRKFEKLSTHLQDQIKIINPAITPKIIQ